MGSFFKWFCRCVNEVGVSDLAQLAPQILSNPMLAAGVGAFILLVLGWNAYQQYQEALQSKQLDRISDYLRRLDQEQFVSLRDAAQKIFIDSEGRVDFGLLTPQERNNPHILLFKFLTERIDVAENHLDALLQNLPEALQGRLALLIYENRSQLVEILQQQHSALAEEFKAELHKTHQVVIDYLKRIEERLVRQGYPPLYIPHCLDENERFLARLLPKSRWVRLIGREAELATLRRFLTPDEQRPFKWTLITAQGGQGKTRLALEVAIEAQAQGWNAGFYRRDAKYDEWERWEPQENTLIIMDYAALQAETARRAILTMAEKARCNGVQLRLMLLERYFSDQEEWCKKLLATGSQNATTVRATYWSPAPADAESLMRAATPSIEPMSLPPLAEGDFIAIMRAYHDQYRAYHHQPPQTLAESDLRQALQNLPAGDYRPLFAAFAGEAIAEKGVQEVRHWNAQQLTEWVLQRDFALWQRRGVDQEHLNLVALATLLGTLDVETAQYLAEDYPDLLPDIDNEFDKTQYNILIAYSPVEVGDTLSGLQPDPLGELLLLE